MDAASPERVYLDWWTNRNAARLDGDVRFEGHSFHVPRTVFSPDPAMTNSTALMFRCAPALAGKSVLDMGTGCGVLGISCALRGAARVTLSDVDGEAVKAAGINVERHGISARTEIVESDLFDRISGRYDIVFANLPLADEVWSHLEKRSSTLVEHFLATCRDHLAAGAVIFIPSASFANVTNLGDVLERHGAHAKETSEAKFGVKWSVFRISFDETAKN